MPRNVSNVSRVRLLGGAMFKDLPLHDSTRGIRKLSSNRPACSWRTHSTGGRCTSDNPAKATASKASMIAACTSGSTAHGFSSNDSTPEVYLYLKGRSSINCRTRSACPRKIVGLVLLCQILSEHSSL